jgi:starvation-inducible DNA-binding protein
MKAKLDLEPRVCQQIAGMLSLILADLYILQVKTQNFHWNIEDHRFHALHKFFEEQYSQLGKLIDEVAERIRMLGQKAPGKLQSFLEMSSLHEAENDLTGEEMLLALLTDHESMVRQMRECILQVTQLNDEGSADLLIQNLRLHEKMAWMLRSYVGSINL